MLVSKVQSCVDYLNLKDEIEEFSDNLGLIMGELSEANAILNEHEMALRSIEKASKKTPPTTIKGIEEAKQTSEQARAKIDVHRELTTNLETAANNSRNTIRKLTNNKTNAERTIWAHHRDELLLDIKASISKKLIQEYWVATIGASHSVNPPTPCNFTMPDEMESFMRKPGELPQFRRTLLDSILY